jgi:hypothetical protein
MLILYVLGISALVIALAVGIDVGEQIWVEKRAERKAFKAKQLEALTVLRGMLVERFAHVLDAEVVELHQKTVGGKHRLVA